MLRDSDDPARAVAKLTRINAALIERLERIEESRGPAYALTRAAAVLEREVVARNRDLEQALADLAAINAELARAREVADGANRAKSRFLRAASHDLLQPLSAARLFLSHLDEISREPLQHDLISHLTATVESAEELIRALSNIAKLDSQNFETNPEPIAIGRLFMRLLIDMQPLAASRGVALRFVASSATVESDLVYLRQIAQNLIANALKYTTGCKVLVGVRHVPGAVWLEVLDRGPGIAARDHERIFNEFERLSCSDQPGTGLGLSIVQRACQQLGHTLELRSEPGRGSCFRVCLPLHRRTRASSNAGPSDPLRETDEGDAASLVARRVLVVENDPVMRRAFIMLLTGWGMEVDAVAGIAPARAAAARAAPDLLLTDYRLEGGETGIQTIHALNRALGRIVPALIVSAESVAAIRAEAGTLDVNILEKPVTDRALRRAMAAALTNHSASGTGQA
jgi:signal transduction histidine kinase/CheY-like chemotaxis protein